MVRAKREAQELELQMRKNEVHTSEDVEQVMSDMLIRFKTRLMAIPAKLSPIMAKKTDQTDIFQTMKTAVDEALEELSDFNTAFEEESKRMRNNTKALFEKIFKVLQPPPDLKLSEWADEYRRLSSEASAEPGRWRTSKAPYQREIMDAITDMTVKKSCGNVCGTGRENRRNDFKSDRLLHTL